MNTKNKLGFKFYRVISGMTICILFTSSCGKLTGYGMNGPQNVQDLEKKEIEIRSEFIKHTDFRTPLHFYAAYGNIEEVINCLKYGITPVNHIDNDDNTPLHYAAGNDHLEMVKKLLSYGAYVNVKNKHYFTPLHYAIKNAGLEVVKELLGSDRININIQNKDGHSALI